MGFDKRVHRRIKGRWLVEYHLADDPEDRAFRATAFDLSESGAGIRTLARLEPGHLVILGLQVPEEARPLLLTARVLSIRPSESHPGHHEVGLRFLEPSRDEVRSLRGILSVKT